MSFLRGSDNYVWCTTSVLGKGATGAVYQGVHKVNGEPVAVKTFNQLSHMRPQDVQMREFEVLKKVNHENIVKLLAIEEETEGRGKVIVMELCTGGSLFNILDDPENAYGLNEDEFLLVVEHLTAGMKHLRDNNLVHRDLKPGNIMKFISDDGTTKYKLTDFGAARELQEGQQFVSLYGTEEYLHPDMYERAVLRKPVGKTFGATVDLWSIGVTLYHVATGNLPFRPYGGRKNRDTMFHITTKKASGVISGIQTSEGGPIEWGRELPITCQLSLGVKKFVTPLLAGLLEADPQRIWGFDKFFNEVTNLLLRKVVYVFYINWSESLKVFMHQDEVYDNLKSHLHEQTGLLEDRQMIIVKNELFSTAIGENTRAEGYPTTSKEEPLFLFNTDSHNVNQRSEAEISKFPEFQKTVSVENDAAQAKQSCSVGHVCKRKIEKISLQTFLIKQFVVFSTQLIKNKVEVLNIKCQHLVSLTRSALEILHTIDTSQAIASLLNSLQQCNFSAKHACDDFKRVSRQFTDETEPAVKRLYERIVIEDTLKSEWNQPSGFIKFPCDTRAIERSRTLIERLRDSWQHLVRDRSTRSLSYNDEQFHILEKKKIVDTGNKLRILLDTECNPTFIKVADIFGEWCEKRHAMLQKADILKQDVNAYEIEVEKHFERARIEGANYNEEIQVVLRRIESGGDLPQRTSRRQSVEVKNRMQTVTANLNDALNKNNEIIDYFLALTQKRVDDDVFLQEK